MIISKPGCKMPMLNIHSNYHFHFTLEILSDNNYISSRTFLDWPFGNGIKKEGDQTTIGSVCPWWHDWTSIADWPADLFGLDVPSLHAPCCQGDPDVTWRTVELPLNSSPSSWGSTTERSSFMKVGIRFKLLSVATISALPVAACLFCIQIFDFIIIYSAFSY